MAMATATAITVRGKLADSRHVELDEPVTEFVGAVEVVLRPADGNGLPSLDRVALARALQATSPPQRSDSVDLIRDDRLR
jgi:hypothetical protein